mgnify:CR=1 FL=1
MGQHLFYPTNLFGPCPRTASRGRFRFILGGFLKAPFRFISFWVAFEDRLRFISQERRTAR